MTEQEEVACMDCGDTYVPNSAKDFYPVGSDPTVGRCERCMIQDALGGGPKAEPAPLPEGYENAVCKRGQGEVTCSFLGISGEDLQCLKGTEFETTIRERLDEGTMGSQGDNCSGPPDFTPAA